MGGLCQPTLKYEKRLNQQTVGGTFLWLPGLPHLQLPGLGALLFFPFGAVLPSRLGSGTLRGLGLLLQQQLQGHGRGNVTRLPHGRGTTSDVTQGVAPAAAAPSRHLAVPCWVPAAAFGQQRHAEAALCSRHCPIPGYTRGSRVTVNAQVAVASKLLKEFQGQLRRKRGR